MNDEVIDLLKIKIETAKRALPLETVNAIDSVDWRASILELRTKKGYTFEQLGDLELETELLLCGLVSPEDYPRELEKRMGISRTQANELVNEMNEMVFTKIRAELIKNTERKRIFAQKEKEIKQDAEVLKEHGIEIIPTVPVHNAPHNEITTLEIQPEEITGKVIEKPTAFAESSGVSKKEETPPASILEQKLTGPFQIPTTKTDHSLPNISSPSAPSASAPVPIITKPKIPNADPYRELPE